MWSLHRSILSRRSLLFYRSLSTAASPSPSVYDWRKLVSPSTSDSHVKELRDLEAELEALRSDAADRPSSLPEVDFSSWMIKIDDKGLVKKIQDEFDASRAKLVEAGETFGVSEEVKKARAEVLEAVNSDVVETVIQPMLDKMYKELDQARQDKLNAPKWMYHDYMNRFPGLAEQVREEYMEGYHLPTDAEERLGEVDFKELAKIAREGLPLPAIDPELTPKVGNYDIRKELRETNAWLVKLFPGKKKEIDERIESQLKKIGAAERVQPVEENAH